MYPYYGPLLVEFLVLFCYCKMVSVEALGFLFIREEKISEEEEMHFITLLLFSSFCVITAIITSL